MRSNRRGSSQRTTTPVVVEGFRGNTEGIECRFRAESAFDDGNGLRQWTSRAQNPKTHATWCCHSFYTKPSSTQFTKTISFMNPVRRKPRNVESWAFGIDPQAQFRVLGLPKCQGREKERRSEWVLGKHRENAILICGTCENEGGNTHLYGLIFVFVFWQRIPF